MLSGRLSVRAPFRAADPIAPAAVLSYLLVKDKDDEARYNFQVDLGLTDFQVAVVTGSVYTFTNGLAGIGFGLVADYYPRKWVWFFACVLWTCFTFAEAFCQTFGELISARIGFAIFMGSCVPVSVSLLSDFTMPSERGVAQSIFAAGVYLGVGMSSISVLLDNALG